MLQSIFNLDSFPLFFLVAGVGLVWGLNEGRKHFTQATPAMQDASTQTTCSEFKDYKNEEVQATPSFMVDASTQTALILPHINGTVKDVSTQTTDIFPLINETADDGATSTVTTTTTVTTATACAQTDAIEKTDVGVTVNKLSYYYTKADKDCAVIYSQYLNRLPGNIDWRTKLGLMYGDELIAYVESREQSLASTSYTHDAPPINAAHASGIPNTQLLGVVEEVFVHA